MQDNSWWQHNMEVYMYISKALKTKKQKQNYVTKLHAHLIFQKSDLLFFNLIHILKENFHNLP